MEFGNKILQLRKQNNLSQEQLAEKMNVARQTISKWELGETSPDLDQAKQLSQIFNVSLDEITNNNIKNVLIDKVNNTEKLSKTIIIFLKIILLIIIIIVTIQLSTIFFKDYFSVKPVSGGVSTECIINEEKYIYEARYKYDEPNVISSFYTNDRNLAIDYKEYDNIDFFIEDVIKDAQSRGGTCNNILTS